MTLDLPTASTRSVTSVRTSARTSARAWAPVPAPATPSALPAAQPGLTRHTMSAAFDMMCLVGGASEVGAAAAGAQLIVGRDAELAALTSLVDSGGAALVGGDAGVGKTRIVTELLATARARGNRVLLGHCLHFGGDTLPYLPISEAFGRLARTDPDLIEVLRRDYPAIDRLLPQQRMIGSVHDDGERTESADLFEAVLGALLVLAKSGPVLLVLEDVHWADSSTRDLIGFLLARSVGERVAIVLTYRTDDLHRRHPLRPVVLEWGRLPGVVRQNVAPLADDPMRELVRLRHKRPLTDEAVERVLRRAGGNPFFAEQLLAELDDCDQLPADLADLLLVRLERLSADATAVVKVAAVSGRRVSHQILREITGLSDDALDRAVREAVDAHVLIRSDGDAFAFRHALLAEAVYDDLLPGERIRLHAAFVAALAAERIVGTDAVLARHARAAVDLPTAYAAGLRAGAEAMRIGAPAEAMRHFEASLELSDSVDANTADLVAVTVAAADAAAAAGHPYRALSLLTDAVDNPPADIDDLDRAELLLALAWLGGSLETGLDLFAITGEALVLAPSDPPSPLLARALAMRARVAHGLDRNDEATRLANDARATALGLRLFDVAADASTTLARIEQRAEDPERAVRLLEASVAEAAQSRDLAAQLRSLHSLGMLRYDRGELGPARLAYQRAVELGSEAGQVFALYPMDALLLYAQAEYVAGNWDHVLELCAPDGQPPPFAAAGLRATAMAVGAGRGDAGLPELLDELRPWWERDGMIGVLSAAATIDALAAQGRVEEALRLHDDAVASVGRVWRNEWFMARIRLHGLALGALADAAAHANSAERGELLERGDQLRADIDRVATNGRTRQTASGPEGRAWIARGAAEWLRLRWRAGQQVDPVELVASWRDAADAFGYGQPEGAGHVFEQARSRTRLAAALLAAADPAGAQRVADLAREPARRLGAQPLLSELRQLSTGDAGLRRATASDEDVSLTAREQQVLRLVSDGRSNREIARALFISDKTVSVHVSNILAKLGAAGRTEAAAIANRRGLLD